MHAGGREALGGGSGGATSASSPAPAPAALHQCAICWGGSEEAAGLGQLLHGTCACSGSLGAVHAACLLEWQRHAAEPGTCPTCRAPFALPPGLARTVRLPPLWQQRLQIAAVQARRRPAAAAFGLWNAGVVACASAHAVLEAQRAWLCAPATSARLAASASLPQRWRLLPAVALAAAWQAAWGPGKLGAQRTRLLLGHAASLAAGLALEGLAGVLQARRAAAAAAAAPAPAAPAAGARAACTGLSSALAGVALVLQLAGEGPLRVALLPKGRDPLVFWGLDAPLSPVPGVQDSALRAHHHKPPRQLPAGLPACSPAGSHPPAWLLSPPAGLQHLHPFLAFARGYQRGLDSALG